MKLFENHTELVEEFQRMPVAECTIACQNLVADGRKIIVECTSEQLAAEMRNPSTPFAALHTAVVNEALARILSACAL